MLASEHASLLEALSERLLSDFSHELWRKVFLGPGYEQLRFERETLTFLCTDTLEFEWTPEDIEALAARDGGRLEQFDQRLVLAFHQARGALQLALRLQHGASCRLRMALVTARCTCAVFELDGRLRRLPIGTEVRQACDCADLLPPGSIHVSAETCRKLGPAARWPQEAARLAQASLQEDARHPGGMTLVLTPCATATSTCADLEVA